MAFCALRCGRMPYRQALALQEELVARRGHETADTLILLAHDPVVTFGRSGRPEHLLLSPEALRQRGIDCLLSSRGGDVTYHGPGQVVGYPIVDLQPLGRDLHRYLRLLEQTLIDALAPLGIMGRRHPGRTGVWVGGRKIASLGIGVRRWVAWHGFALNLEADLGGFASIVPCGLPGVEMTSVADELGQAPERSTMEDLIIAAFAQAFGAICTDDHGPKS